MGSEGLLPLLMSARHLTAAEFSLAFAESIFEDLTILPIKGIETEDRIPSTATTATSSSRLKPFEVL